MCKVFMDEFQYSNSDDFLKSEILKKSVYLG
jgi:hypothetical protein